MRDCSPILDFQLNMDNFTARNETTIIYCQLDDGFMVVKVNKEDENLRMAKIIKLKTN